MPSGEDDCRINADITVDVGVTGDSMMGISALDGFLPRRCKERHVLIKEMVACLDALHEEAAGTHPIDLDRLADSRPAVAGQRAD